MGLKLLRSPKRLLYGFLVTTCCVFMYFTITWHFHHGLSPRDDANSMPNVAFQPLILVFTNYFSRSMLNVNNSLPYDCPWKCNFTEDHSKYNIADAVVWHARDAAYDPWLSNNTNPFRLNVFFSLEASPNENITVKNFPPDFFNISMSFRRDSDITLHYDQFEPALPEDFDNPNVTWSDEAVDAAIAQKTNLAVQFVSNCNTSSEREFLIDKLLNKTTEIDIFGSCRNRTCNKTCENEILPSYYFYLAFENSVCNDYVTEKFWRLKQLIVPVVLKRSNLHGILDDSYFLAVDDFKNIEDFIKALEFYKNHPDEYKKFFGWTKLFRKTNVYHKSLCKLCKLMTTSKIKKVIPNIVEWWHDPNQCEAGFASRIWEL